MKKYIIYAGTFVFPDKNAAALRVRGIGKCLSELGYELLFLGDQYDKEKPCEAVEYQEDGFVYRTRKKWTSAEYYVKADYITQCIQEIGTENVYSVILYHPPAIQAMKVKHFCDKNGIKLIADVTEWYDIKRQLSNGHMWIRAIDFWIRMHYVNRKIKNIIAISSYLEEYYRKRKCITVKVPILLEKEPKIPEIIQNNSLSLCYCGSPTKKDMLLPVVKVVEQYVDDGFSVSFDIVGTDRDEFERINGYAVKDKYKDMIRFHGRVSHENALKILSRCDFSLIIRPNLRYAIAGFPTKMVEAFSSGVGVIASGNGDINTYVKTGMNGYIISPNNIDSELNDVINKLLSLPRDEIDKIKSNAFGDAINNFCYKLYIDRLSDFLRRI